MNNKEQSKVFPAVAVIVSTYNRADLLASTLDSLIGQDYPAMHIFIMDDESTDSTASFVESYQRHCSFLSYFHHSNAGEAFTINRGLAEAAEHFPQFTYFATISSDDPVLPGWLGNLVDYMEENPDTDIVYPSWYMIDSAGAIIRPRFNHSQDFPSLFETAALHPGPGALYRRRILTSSPLRTAKYRYCGDFYMWLNLMLNFRVDHYKKTLSCWRMHGGSLTYQGRSQSKADEFIQMMRDFIGEHSANAIVQKKQRRALAAVYMQAALIQLRTRQLPKTYLQKAFGANFLWCLFLALEFALSAFKRRAARLYYKLFPGNIQEIWRKTLAK